MIDGIEIFVLRSMYCIGTLPQFFYLFIHLFSVLFYSFINFLSSFILLFFYSFISNILFIHLFPYFSQTRKESYYLIHPLISFLFVSLFYYFLPSFSVDTKGMEMDDDELLALISERKTISKTIDQYEGNK